MSFFTLSDGSSLANSTGTFEIGGGKTIPDGTQVLAVCDNVEWVEPSEFYENERISLTWSIVAPKDYEGQKIFQKLKVMDAKETTAVKAKEMLLAIDKNAKGKLASIQTAPTTEDLQRALVMAMMILKVGLLKTEEGKEINWVKAVSPKQPKNKPASPATKQVASEKAEVSEKVAPGKPEGARPNDFDDDIPF